MGTADVPGAGRPGREDKNPPDAAPQRRRPCLHVAGVCADIHRHAAVRTIRRSAGRSGRQHLRLPVPQAAGAVPACVQCRPHHGRDARGKLCVFLLEQRLAGVAKPRQLPSGRRCQPDVFSCKYRRGCGNYRILHTAEWVPGVAHDLPVDRAVILCRGVRLDPGPAFVQQPLGVYLDLAVTARLGAVPKLRDDHRANRRKTAAYRRIAAFSRASG